MMADALMDARLGSTDLWTIEVNIFPVRNGWIELAAPRKQTPQVLSDFRISKYMCHSFSFGMDALIGYSFERR